MSTSGLRDQLQTIYDRRGRLTPALVVDEARDASHPLHHRFEWDNTVAGARWREQQAHELIRSVKISYATQTGAVKDVRAFHAVRQPTGHVYEPVERVVTDDVMRQVVLADMERQWRELRRRFEHFDEFAQMVQRDLGENAA